MTKILYCQATWREDFEDTKLCIKRVSPHVDATVISYDQTVTKEQLKWLHDNVEKYNVHPVYHHFKDNLPEMRNSYLEKAKELGADWCAVSDPDELYSEELAKNLRRLIEENKLLGYNLLPVHVRDQFENVEWLDELDLLKETPGGYRETFFWKPLLIFKVYPDLHYLGVGVEKNVHEMLKSSTPWKSRNLSKEFYYTHRKSALRIWRNAARNMYIGGGGDNVGEINPHWPVLRSLLLGMDIKNWGEFERFVEEGTEDPQFHKWLLEALQTPPTNWGTETRETAKWYFTFHKGQITPEIREHLETPPEMTPEIEAENFVIRAYFQVLGRHPDEEGKKAYVQALLEGKIKHENVIASLRQSQEFRQKAGIIGPVETVPIQVPVDVNVRITEDLILEALKRSKMYWDTIKPKMDIGGVILSGLRRRDELLKWFYANKEEITAQELLEWVVENAPKPDSVALCIMGYREVQAMINEIICTVGPYVDEIHVQGDNFTEHDIEVFEECMVDVKVHIEPWVDEFSDYKNKCIAPANTEWVLICDHDEIPTPDLAKKLKKIIKESNRGRNYNMVGFDVIDVGTVNEEPISEHRSPSGKALLHWNVQDPYYGNPHIWLKQNYYPWKVVRLPHAYRHVKEVGTGLARSVRNVYLGGGGDNTREKNPMWLELRVVCTDLLIKSWAEFNETLKEGDIPFKLLDVLRRLEEVEWKDDELKDPLKYYYQIHPDEADRYE
ncbi:MAG: DUF4214 domain-containing protein [Thermoplasmata archaeon]|nr:DUF4214 domain-containing protein [Thermoplasmata archaeon]